MQVAAVVVRRTCHHLGPCLVTHTTICRTPHPLVQCSSRECPCHPRGVRAAAAVCTPHHHLAAALAGLRECTVAAARVLGVQALGAVKTLAVRAGKTLVCTGRGDTTMRAGLAAPHTGVVVAGVARTEQQQQEGRRGVLGVKQGVLLVPRSTCRLQLRDLAGILRSSCRQCKPLLQPACQCRCPVTCLRRGSPCSIQGRAIQQL
jgi:hypothetical protein